MTLRQAEKRRRFFCLGPVCVDAVCLSVCLSSVYLPHACVLVTVCLHPDCLHPGCFLTWSLVRFSKAVDKVTEVAKHGSSIGLRSAVDDDPCVAVAHLSPGSRVFHLSLAPRQAEKRRRPLYDLKETVVVHLCGGSDHHVLADALLGEDIVCILGGVHTERPDGRQLPNFKSYAPAGRDF